MNANKPNRKALFNFYNREGGYAVLIHKYLQHIQDIRQLYDFQRDGFEDYPAKPTMWMRTIIRSDFILNRVAECKSLLPGSNVLDLGCGRGEWLELCQENNLVAIGIDINKVMISRCKDTWWQLLTTPMMVPAVPQKTSFWPTGSSIPMYSAASSLMT